jgi:hypothetical protein
MAIKIKHSSGEFEELDQGAFFVGVPAEIWCARIVPWRAEEGGAGKRCKWLICKP